MINLPRTLAARDTPDFVATLADDPTTIDCLPEYCELRLSIDPSDAATLIEFDPEISP